MAATLLISASEIIDRCLPDRSLDQGYIKDSYIEAAQMDYLRPFLGDDFYDALISSPTTYAALAPYYKDMLAFYVMADIVPLIHTNINTGGITTNSTEYTSPASRELRSDLQKTFLKFAKEFQDKFYRFLYKNSSTYTLWSPVTTGGLVGGIPML